VHAHVKDVASSSEALKQTQASKRCANQHGIQECHQLDKVVVVTMTSKTATSLFVMMISSLKNRVNHT